jgi:peptide deformylase
MSQTERTERGPTKGRRERAEVPPERQAAARRQIRTLGDPVLREQARPVEKFDDELAALSRRMVAVMRDAPGVGLAATQLGVVQRVLVYDVDDDPVTLVNPRIVAASRETEVAEEGCLSLPGMNLQVERAVVVHVRARDVRGRRLDFEAEGLEARVIQHETDHLDGILILERATREERARALREFREREIAAVSPVSSGSGL